MRAGRWGLSRWSRIVGLAVLLGQLPAANADDGVDSWVGGMLAAQTQVPARTQGVPAEPQGNFADLSLTIIDSPDPAPVGTNVNYQAIMNFSSPLAGTEAGSVQLTFFYTAGMVFQGASGAGWSCTPGTVIQCSLGGVLTAPQTSQVNLQFQMPNTPQTVQLRGTASFIGPTDSNPSNNTNITQTTQVVEIGADLSLNLQPGNSNVVAGDPVSFTAQVGNLGPASINGLTLTGTASGPVSLTSLSGSGWSCTNSATSYNCSYGPNLLAGNNTPVLTISGTSGPAGGSAQLSATANAPDANAPAQQTALVNVLTPAVLTLSKTDSADPVQIGQQFSYNLRVTNTGGQAAPAGLQLTDNLPPEVSFIGAFGSGWSCVGSSTVQCTLAGSLAAGASSTVQIDVRAEQAGVANNTALVGDSGGSGASASQTTTIVSQPQLNFTKRADRSQVQIGETVSFDLTVRNTGSTAVSNLRLSDRIPNGLALVSATGAGWSCADSGGTVICNRVSLAAGGEASVTIETDVLGPAGPVLNLANLSVGGSSQQSASASVTVIDQPPPPAPDLSLSKTDDVDPVNVDAEFNYLLTVGNSGASATGLTLAGQLPEGLTLVSASGSGWSCGGGSLVSCSFPGTLATGASTQVVLRVRAPSTPGQLLNQASVSTEGETNTANNSASETTTVVSDGGGGQPPVADLALDGSVDPLSGLPDSIVSFTLLPSNAGPDAAAGSVVSGTAVSGLSLLTADGVGYECNVVTSSFECAGPAVPVGAGGPLLVRARLVGVAGSTARLNATISGPTQDPNPVDNQVVLQASIEVPVPTGADLALGKTASANPVEAGAEFSYTLTVTNAGPAAAENVVLTDPLPGSLSLVSVSGSGLSCSGGAVVSCQAAALAVGASASVLINVRAPAAAGDVQNTASVSSTSTDPNPANNSASATVGIDERSAENIEDELMALVVDDPTAAAAAGPVSQICADPSAAFAEQCRILLQAAEDGRSDDVSDALRAIAPDEVLGQTAAILELADRQFVNVDARLAELRGGAGGFSLSGLTVISGGQAVPFSLFQGMLADEEMEVGGSGDLISPWGGFINGTISWGDQDLDRGNSNVTQEYDSYALTAGVDYRFGVNAVAGVALGYSNLDADLSEQGEMTAKGLTLSGYGSYYINDRTYVDGRVSYNRGDLDQVRFIRFGSGGDRIDLRAVGSTDSSQFSVAVGAGYHYNTGPWVITPSGYLRYTDVSVDGFSESGAGANSAVFGDQEISTVQTGVGISVTRAFSLSHGVISPQLDINFVHESTDDLLVRARLVGADPSIVFLLEPDDPDESYGNVGLGFVYVTANGRQAYLSYRETFGLDGLSSGTINVGARFEF